MVEKKLIYTDEGTFVDIKYGGAKDPLNIELGVWQNQKIKISSKKIQLNEHGGYISEELKEQCAKQFISIDPSAVIGDVHIGKNVRGMEIGKNCIIGDDVSFKSDQRDCKITIESGVIIGENNTLKNNIKILTQAEIGAGNSFIGGKEDDFTDPEYDYYSIGMDSRIGNNNKFSGNFTVHYDCHIGNDNVFGEDTDLGHNLIIKDSNTIGAYNVFHAGITIGSDIGTEDTVSVGAESTINDGVLIGDETSLGYQNELGKGVKIRSGCRIGNKAKIHAGAEIDWRSQIGDEADIGAGAEIGGACILGDKVTVKPNVKVKSCSEIASKKVITQRQDKNSEIAK